MSELHPLNPKHHLTSASRPVRGGEGDESCKIFGRVAKIEFYQTSNIERSMGPDALLGLNGIRG
jgi:hypothetical protein